MHATKARQPAFAKDKCAGLVFLTDGDWCRFRADCGLDFNWPLDKTLPYAVIDLETDTCIGFLDSQEFIGLEEPPMFRVFALHPLIEHVRPQ